MGSAALTQSPSGRTQCPKVLHFVTGGFSGATQVALDLVQAHAQSGVFDAMLVLRRKPQTDMQRVYALREKGVHVEVVTHWPHFATIWQLRQLCLQWQPDILVAHGFSDHIWGRYAGLWAGVKHLVHVEHNSRERYTWWRLQQALWLAQRTDRIIGCSQGVKASLLALGFPPEKTMAISNGIRLDPYTVGAGVALQQREPGLVMAARFANQKDHQTLIEALALLRHRGMTPPLWLPGGGSSQLRKRAERLSASLGVAEQVHFMGFQPGVPGLLMRNQICVLSSRYEGMPLSLIEGMAAGCVVIGSRVPGIQEVIDHEHNGLLVAPQSAPELADAIERVLRDPAAAQQWASQGRQDALSHYSFEHMAGAYEHEFASLLGLAQPEPLDQTATGLL